MTWGAISMSLTPWPSLAVAPSALSVFAFALAVACLAAFDISLPRGDVVGVSAALDAVTFVVFGPGAALVIASIGLFAAYAVRERNFASANMMVALATRSVGLVSALAVAAALGSLGIGALVGEWSMAALAVIAYFASESLANQLASTLRTRRSLLGLLRGNLRRQMPVLLGELSAALLAILVYGSMVEWGLLLVVALLLLIRQSYAQLLGIAETYRTTVEVLVSAAEGTDTERSGHAERTAHIARELAAACRLSAQEVERVSYAALLHDLSTLSVSESSKDMRVPASAVLADVRFFARVVGVLRVCEGEDNAGEGLPEADQAAALIVALASDIDAAERPAVHTEGQSGLVARVARSVDRPVKARVVAAALRLGYRVPAVP